MTRPTRRRPARPAPRAKPRPSPAQPPEPAPEPAAAPPEPVRALACPERCDFDRIDSTAMFDTLGEIRALPVAEVGRAIARRSLADARGYTTEELYGIAEIGHQYIRSGGHRLAKVLFEGLVAVAPDTPYFWLGLGHVHDHLGDKAEARAAFEAVIRLDPNDPVPEVNVAELDLEAGQRRRAIQRLRAGVRKARTADQPALERKATALLTLIAPTRDAQSAAS